MRCQQGHAVFKRSLCAVAGAGHEGTFDQAALVVHAHFNYHWRGFGAGAKGIVQNGPSGHACGCQGAHNLQQTVFGIAAIAGLFIGGHSRIRVVF